MNSPLDDLEDGVETILHQEKAIHARLDVLARDITADYRGKEITALAILQGSMIFMADLLRRIPLPLRIKGTIATYPLSGSSTKLLCHDD